MNKLYLERAQTGPDWKLKKRRKKKTNNHVPGLTLHSSRSQAKRSKLRVLTEFLLGWPA